MKIFFTYPLYLSILFLAPLLIFLHWVSLRIRKKRALKFANFDAIARIKGIEIYSKNLGSLIMTLIILILLVFSVAGANLEYDAKTSSVAFVLALDNSQSMEATDIFPTRLEAAKKDALSFVDYLPEGTQIGIVSFSGNAVIENPVTSDRALLKRAISNIDFGSIGGTDIYEAVKTSADLLKGYPKKSIVLISDGQINVGTVEEAIDYAQERDVFIHTIAVGTSEGGQTSYGLSKIDENSLKSLAYNTEGSSFLASEEEELFLSLKQIAEIGPGTVTKSVSNYLLLITIILIFIHYALFNARLKEFP